jgi:hypothetical protein
MGSNDDCNAAGLLHEPTSCPTFAGAIAAIQHAMTAAALAGHAPSTLCATLKVHLKSTTVMLGTRAWIADAATNTGARPGVVDAIRAHAPEEAILLVEVDGQNTYVVGLSKLLDVVGVLTAQRPVN